MTQNTPSCDACTLASGSPCSFRPGGLELTKRLLQRTHLDETSRVLDIACGSGTTDVFIAEQYRSSVMGIDISPMMIESSRNYVEEKKLSRIISFFKGSAECLPFPDETFDAVICECSFTLADSRRTAGEMARVLKHGGKALISNVFLKENSGVTEASPNFSTGCLRTAKTLDEQIECLEEAGFRDIYTEDHSRAIKEIALRIIMKTGRMKKLSGECAENTPFRSFKTPGYGYAIITGVKP